MNENKKMEIIAEILELEVGEFSASTVLKDIETWDSVAVLSFIAIMNEEFNKYPMADEINSYVTVGDLMDVMK
ncbi:phosphopantetheine-binding protein [Anaerovibrio slackiae]|uniref:phosphopantetheine-binding protein n=1 Tax=Anaerovibrio slackiae TaxID=2652309 RepID=UPI003F13F231